MRVGEFDVPTLARHLAAEGLTLRIGPFAYSVTSDVPELADTLRTLYADFPLTSERLVDFHLSVRRATGVRRWWRPKVYCEIDGAEVLHPLPRPLAGTGLEMLLNWSTYAFAHQHLYLHAGVVENRERDGALLLPAASGSGKSTLTAALVLSGWRLLSDELAVFRVETGELLPLARPVSLKNDSIRIIREFAPDAVFGPISVHPEEGSMAHMRPPTDSVAAIDRTARPAWIVFPHYRAGAVPRIQPLPKARALFRLSTQVIVRQLLDPSRFELLANIVDACPCYDFWYGSLSGALAGVDEVTRLAGGERSAA